MIKFKLTPLQKFLCLSIRHFQYLDSEQIKQLYLEIGDAKIFDEAKVNGVASIVGHTLTVVLGKENVPGHWLREYEEVDARVSAYMDELERIARRLGDEGIELLALKNSGITKGLYPHHGACPMGDVDVLVSRAKFREAHAILVDAGYQLKFRSPLEEDT